MKTIRNYHTGVYIAVIFFLFTGGIAFGQNDNNCSDYIRAWGIVKYLVPYSENDLPNLDSAFLHDINKLIHKNTKYHLNIYIKKLFEYSKSKSFSTGNQINNSIDFTYNDSLIRWITNNSRLNLINKRTLTSLIQQKREDNTPFVNNGSENANVNFTNEKRYLLPFPSVEIRMLALARYWNAINYFYPHKIIIPVDWDEVLESFQDKLINCKSESEYDLTILHLATLIEDSHGVVHSLGLEKYYGYYRLPIKVSYFDEKIFITKIQNGLVDNPFRFGDILLEINNQSFEEFFKKDSANIWGSNLKRKKNLCADHFLMSKKDTINLIKIKRNDSIILIKSSSLSLATIKETDLIHYRPIPEYQIGENYIYLNLNNLDSTKFEKLVTSSKKPNIIIDLREYPSNFSSQIVSLFTPTIVPFAIYKYPKISLPGRLSESNILTISPRGWTSPVLYEHIILMVDYTTISRGEFISMAFQSLPNVLTVGDKTAGADGDISKMLLPGNISTQFTGLEILYPNGQKTQKIGIKIDVNFQKKGGLISAGKDEELLYILNSILPGL